VGAFRFSEEIILFDLSKNGNSISVMKSLPFLESVSAAIFCYLPIVIREEMPEPESLTILESLTECVRILPRPGQIPWWIFLIQALKQPVDLSSRNECLPAQPSKRQLLKAPNQII
jgi:hypothetical protein